MKTRSLAGFSHVRRNMMLSSPGGTVKLNCVTSGGGGPGGGVSLTVPSWNAMGRPRKPVLDLSRRFQLLIKETLPPLSGSTMVCWKDCSHGSTIGSAAAGAKVKPPFSYLNPTVALTAGMRGVQNAGVHGPFQQRL